MVVCSCTPSISTMEQGASTNTQGDKDAVRWLGTSAKHRNAQGFEKHPASVAVSAHAAAGGPNAPRSARESPKGGRCPWRLRSSGGLEAEGTFSNRALESRFRDLAQQEVAEHLDSLT